MSKLGEAFSTEMKTELVPNCQLKPAVISIHFTRVESKSTHEPARCLKTTKTPFTQLNKSIRELDNTHMCTEDQQQHTHMQA